MKVKFKYFWIFSVFLICILDKKSPITNSFSSHNCRFVEYSYFLLSRTLDSVPIGEMNLIRYWPRLIALNFWWASAWARKNGLQLSIWPTAINDERALMRGRYCGDGYGWERWPPGDRSRREKLNVSVLWDRINIDNYELVRVTEDNSRFFWCYQEVQSNGNFCNMKQENILTGTTGRYSSYNYFITILYWSMEPIWFILYEL